MCFVKLLNLLLACRGSVDIFAETVRKNVPTGVGIVQLQCKLSRFLRRATPHVHLSLCFRNSLFRKMDTKEAFDSHWFTCEFSDRFFLLSDFHQLIVEALRCSEKSL